MHNLFQALFLVSGNDAANAMANAAGGVQSTVAAMNATAKSLGALDTTVRNAERPRRPRAVHVRVRPAVIARAAMARQDFRDYVTTVKSQFPGKMPRAGKVRKTFEIYTQDRLLLNYRGAIGVKTGWTTKARGTFVGAATRGGRTLVATVLHSEGDAWRDSAAPADLGLPQRRRGPTGRHPRRGHRGRRGRRTKTSEAARGRAGAAAATAAWPATGGGLPWWLESPLVAARASSLCCCGRVLLRRRLRRPAAGPRWSGRCLSPRDRAAGGE